MMDRNEIIRRLEKIAGHALHTAGEPPLVLSLDDGVALYDAATLLEEQEPRPVIKDMYDNAYCPHCSTERTVEMGVCRLHLGTKFCPYCGKAVTWNDE